MGLQADHVLDLLRHPVGIGTGKVDLVDHREHIQIVVQGQIHVGQGLGLDPLGRVHHQDGSVAGRQAPGHLVVKVHVSGSVNKVENIFFSVFCFIYRPHGLGLDGDAPLSLKFHVVKHLGLHLPAGQQPCHFDDPVRQR